MKWQTHAPQMLLKNILKALDSEIEHFSEIEGPTEKKNSLHF